MSYSGDAAEQVVRLSLETGEAAVKLAGVSAKQLAILLYAILRDQKKTKGKIRLTNMLRSGKELKVFAVKDTELSLFCQEAKKYGVLYCVLKDQNATDGITDIMVRAEDASKINRIFERFHLATVDIDSAKSETERDQDEKTEEEGSANMTEKDKDAFLDDLFQPAPTQEEGQTQNPIEGQTAKSRQSEPTSEPSEPSATGISEPKERPSVRQELKDIKTGKGNNAEDRSRQQSTQQQPHRAPRKKKLKKQKER